MIVRVEKNSYTVEKLAQWDLNQTLEIYGLSMAKTPEVHFTTDTMVAAVRRYATMDEAGIIRVEIPNALLQQAQAIKAMVCIREGEIFKTYRTLRIPVRPRQRPADYTITDDQDVLSFRALEDKVTDSVAQMQASNAALQEALTAQYESVAQPVAGAVETANAAAAEASAAAEVAQGIAGTAQEAKTTAQQALATAQEPSAVYFTVALPVSGWAGVEAPYVQEVAVDGILVTDRPRFGVVYSDAQATRVAEKAAFALVDDLDTAEGLVTFTAFGDKPAADLTIQMEVVR
jgi:hypothetical protein